MILEKQKSRKTKTKINVVVKGEEIKPKSQIKILGFRTTENLSMDEQANNLIMQVNNKLNAVKNVEKYMDFKTRLRYADSHIISLINYGLPLYLNENQNVKDKIYKIILKSARWVHGNYCYKQSCRKILGSLNWKLPDEQIEDAAARFFHKVVTYKEPEDIYSLVRYPRSRINAEVSMKIIAKNKPFSKLMLNHMANILNRIPEGLKGERPHLFKKKLKAKRLKDKK